jgi:hypothetical protein
VKLLLDIECVRYQFLDKVFITSYQKKKKNHNPFFIIFSCLVCSPIFSKVQRLHFILCSVYRLEGMSFDFFFSHGSRVIVQDEVALENAAIVCFKKLTQYELSYHRLVPIQKQQKKQLYGIIQMQIKQQKTKKKQDKTISNEK